MEQEEGQLGYVKYSGELVRDGYLDARKSALGKLCITPKISEQIAMISPLVTLMKRTHAPSCHRFTLQRKWCVTLRARDGKVPFIR